MTHLALDYGEAATETLLRNLSGIAIADPYLWTVSDEGRTVECLRRNRGGFALVRQFRLDDLVSDLPGGKGAELDLESIDIGDGMLWLCGSHCRVRRKPRRDGELNHKIRKRPSRHLLAKGQLEEGGAGLAKVRTARFGRKKSLHHMLSGDRYLGPFVDLPSKENGLDIEGLVAFDDELVLGLRGPLLDSFAVVVHARTTRRLQIKSYRLSFLDLGGLAVRELTRFDDRLLIVAGPVADAPGPFRLYGWFPSPCKRIQTPSLLFEWPEGREKPEGICPLARSGKPGIIVLYDSPDDARIDGSRYAADWVAVPT